MLRFKSSIRLSCLIITCSILFAGYLYLLIKVAYYPWPYFNCLLFGSVIKLDFGVLYYLLCICSCSFFFNSISKHNGPGVM